MTKQIPNTKKAEQLGVTTRTLRTWEEKGILPPSTRINGRRYHNADAMPQERQRLSASKAR